MTGRNDYGEPKVAQHRRGTQAIVNESWPLSDKAGEHARGIEDQPEPIAVEVRIEWAADGEEWLLGRAWRWTKSHVFVRFQDPRSATGFVWVLARRCAKALTSTAFSSMSTGRGSGRTMLHPAVSRLE